MAGFWGASGPGFLRLHAPSLPVGEPDCYGCQVEPGSQYEPLRVTDLVSALGGTRTPNLLIRSQMLYPIELQALGGR